MTAPVIRGTGMPGYLGGLWSTYPQAGDFLVAISAGVNDYGFGADRYTPTGWNAYSGMDTGYTRVYTRTANGGAADNINTPFMFGYALDLYENPVELPTHCFAFSNGANTSIDYAAGTWSSYLTSAGSSPPVAPPPRNNTTLTVSDGLLITVATADIQGYGGYVEDSSYGGNANSAMNVPTGMTASTTMGAYNVVVFDAYGTAWENVNSRATYQQLAATTNPGSRTFPYTAYAAFGASNQWVTGSIVIKVAAPSGPTAYGPSIRR